MILRNISGSTLGQFSQFFSPHGRYLFIDDRSEPIFYDSSRNVVMTTNFGQYLRKDLYSARWRPETDWNTAVVILKYSMAIVLCKFDEDWTRNPGDYEVRILFFEVIKNRHIMVDCIIILQFLHILLQKTL